MNFVHLCRLEALSTLPLQVHCIYDGFLPRFKQSSSSAAAAIRQLLAIGQEANPMSNYCGSYDEMRLPLGGAAVLSGGFFIRQL